MPSKRPSNAALDALRRARLQEVQERIKRLKRENAWGDAKMVLKEDFDRCLGHLGQKVRLVLYSKMENELPVQCQGLDACAIRLKLRGAADEILDEMVSFLETFEFARPPRLPDRSLQKKMKTKINRARERRYTRINTVLKRADKILTAAGEELDLSDRRFRVRLLRLMVLAARRRGFVRRSKAAEAKVWRTAWKQGVNL